MAIRPRTWTVAETAAAAQRLGRPRSARTKLVAWSTMVDGHRADYVDSPAYLYADGRGTFTRFEKAACDGQMIAHKRADGSFEVIPVECTSFGLSLDGHTGTAVALDEDGGTLGPAETRLSRGLVYVTPVDKAFSYLVKPGPVPAVTLKCDREVVVPGETVSIEGSTTQPFHVPADATPGKRLWHQIDGAWIDFTVRPMVDASLRLDKTLRLELNLAPAQADRGRDHPGRRNPQVDTAAGEVPRIGVSVEAARGRGGAGVAAGGGGRAAAIREAVVAQDGKGRRDRGDAGGSRSVGTMPAARGGNTVRRPLRRIR